MNCSSGPAIPCRTPAGRNSPGVGTSPVLKKEDAMIELPVVSADVARAVIENFTIVATVILLYSFIPDTLLKRSRLIHSLSVGIVFGLAAIISIPAFWLNTGPVLGINMLLVPLAGYASGPVSSAIVALVLLTGCWTSNGTPSLIDTLTIMSGILVGAFVYYFRTRGSISKKARFPIVILGIGVLIIEIASFAVAGLIQPVVTGSGPGPAGAAPGLISILPFLVISFFGTLLLGAIIVYIDRKREAEQELLLYKEHLEGLVRVGTAELRQANSLLKATIEAAADGIVVSDRDGIIRAYNRKAARILDLPAHPPPHPAESWEFSRHIAAVLPDPGTVVRIIATLPDSAEQIVATDLKFSDGRIYEIYVHPQFLGERIAGRVWSIHDITERRLAEDAITTANDKLILLSTLTRHDIFNQLTALAAYVELAEAKPFVNIEDQHFSAMKKILEVIRVQLEFTRDYELLGLNKPGWEAVEPAFSRAAESFGGRGVSFMCSTGHLEIFADPMIGQVFHNLIDNSIRHGERVSATRLSVQNRDSDLLIIYEDNGVGVIPEEKEKVFFRGFGKHTGLGMFLIKEILSITGMTIRENGTPGEGVRFEIGVPQGKYRFTS
jgi:signal transduction histidine kinase